MRGAVAGLVLVALLAACVEPVRPEADRAPRAQSVWPVGFPDVRIWGDGGPRSAADAERVRREAGTLSFGADGRLDILALSGGSAKGAYGAGYLNGWTARGDRPEFDVVTGISTGAIIAPFAFLGPDYDAHLTRFYTTTRTQDIVRQAILPAIFGGGPALGDTAPLRARIAAELDAQVIARIADEHRRGRRLFVGTTDLDAQRPVIWDIGAIAASGKPGAADLIHGVILASASVPVVFPPVLFEVTDGADTFAELHVDGGVTREMFVYPRDVSLKQALGSRLPKRRTFWLLHNGRLGPDPLAVTPRTIEIASRSLETLVKSQTRGDVERIARIAQRDGFGFRLTTIPAAFELRAEGVFDPAWMTALYNEGIARALSPRPWYDSLDAAVRAEAALAVDGPDGAASR